MSELRDPTQSHAEFDAYCDGLEDWQTLPEPNVAAAGRDPEHEEESPLDEQILTGLVSPW